LMKVLGRVFFNNIRKASLATEGYLPSGIFAV